MDNSFQILRSRVVAFWIIIELESLSSFSQNAREISVFQHGTLIKTFDYTFEKGQVISISFLRWVLKLPDGRVEFKLIEPYCRKYAVTVDQTDDSLL